jgi:hypothetical protein
MFSSTKQARNGGRGNPRPLKGEDFEQLFFTLSFGEGRVRQQAE